MYSDRQTQCRFRMSERSARTVCGVFMSKCMVYMKFVYVVAIFRAIIRVDPRGCTSVGNILPAADFCKSPDAFCVELRCPVRECQCPIFECQCPILECQYPILECQYPILECQSPYYILLTMLIPWYTYAVSCEWSWGAHTMASYHGRGVGVLTRW